MTRTTDDSTTTGTAAADGVRGDLLSCYSAAFAACLAAYGVDQNLAVGGQLFLGLRRDGELLEFLHHHTPLSGDADFYRLDMRRRGAADPESAAESIRAEAERRGIALVTGSTGTLPWIDRGSALPAPHWFVVRPSAGSTGQVAVDDRFTWLDEHGDHPGFQGTVAAAEVGRLAWSPLPVGAEALSRERWALGDPRVRPAWSAARPWQWWECASATVRDASGVGFGRAVLERSSAGAITDPSVASRGWTVGRAAFDELADAMSAGLGEPDTYRCGTDLWVAYRNRQAFAAALHHAQRLGVAGGLDGVGAWVSGELVPSWAGVTRAMRYNALRVQQGVRPHTGLLPELRRLGELEDEARRRLATALAGG
ncbi:hypothetical protein [Streptomyces sp. NPDC021020]|uniref:hypothetical protein n=1 Tax=Streptomyces sp. NPDC021020 TaxID=3365109 RepID=UPI0037B750AA